MRLKSYFTRYVKVEKTLKGTLVSIPSPSVKIQIMGGEVCLRCKGKTLLGVVNKLLKLNLCCNWSQMVKIFYYFQIKKYSVIMNM